MAEGKNRESFSCCEKKRFWKRRKVFKSTFTKKKKLKECGSLTWSEIARESERERVLEGDLEVALKQALRLLSFTFSHFHLIFSTFFLPLSEQPLLVWGQELAWVTTSGHRETECFQNNRALAGIVMWRDHFIVITVTTHNPILPRSPMAGAV